MFASRARSIARSRRPPRRDASHRDRRAMSEKEDLSALKREDLVYKAKLAEQAERCEATRGDATRTTRRARSPLARALRSGVNNPNDGDASKPRPPSSCSAPTLNARLGPRAASRETTRRTRTTMTRARPRRRRSWTRHRRRGTRDVNGKGLARGSSGGGTRDARDAFGSAIALTRFRRRNRANGD